MAPIHDTDLAEKRWAQSEWKHYELWEKIEQNLIRRRRVWIACSILLFILISAIPIVRESLPKWETLKATRIVAQEMSMIKRQANLDHAAYQFKVSEDRKSYAVTKLQKCSDASGLEVKKVDLDQRHMDLVFISPTLGQSLKLPGLVDVFCFDPAVGSQLFEQGKAVSGIAVASAKDLAENRLDRVSILLITGSLAELTYSSLGN